MKNQTITRLYAISMFLLLLVSCTGPAPLPVDTPQPAPSPTIMPFLANPSDLEQNFQGFTGAFVLRALKSDQTLRFNPERCAKGFLPASTFKILNSLIGLETGVIPDENYLIKWNGTKYATPSWNRDHTLKTAFQNSVVWYYQELARRVGQEKLQHYLDAVSYGNRDLTGKIDSFWLDGALRISADEQVAFLKRLYLDDLPFSQRSLRIVKEILVLEKMETYQLSGKTGATQMGTQNLGWFVGYLEKKGEVYFFATNIESANPEANGLKAKEISLDILRRLELLP
jgi:beta-lactamase class D